jgi:hypothetical protein
VSETTQAGSVQVEYDRWLWWCRDNKAVQDQGLGLANCLVCAAEPTQVFAWECGPEHNCPNDHAQRGVAQHVRFEGCGHLVDVVFSWEALDRIYS